MRARPKPVMGLGSASYGRLMARTPLRYNSALVPAEVETTGPQPVPQWWRGPDPDPELVRRLYVTEGCSERDLAVILGVSRTRLAAVLTGLGLERGARARQVCPLDAGEVRRLVEQGETAGGLARRFGVSWDTAGRWLAEIGLLPADPGIDPARLHELYVEQLLTTREVAAQLGVDKGRVLRALAAAGIPARPRTQRRLRGARAALTDEALRALYADLAMTVERAAAHFGVNEDHLRGRIHLLGLSKRPGSFTAHLPGATLQGLAARAPELYQDGWTLQQIADELGTSNQTVRLTLHDARLPVRAGGGARGEDGPARVLVDELYDDPQIIQVLRRHQVRLPGPQGWRRAGPRESYAPLPLANGLLRALYADVGLAMNEIAMLCGVGTGTVRSGLLAHHIALRSNRQASPWKQRRYRPT